MSEDVPDPATGLSPREKRIVRETWELVKSDMKGNGYDLFIRFFTENPTYQQHFKAFKNVPLDQMRGNKKVAAHAASVLYAITSLVDNLEDPECLVEMLLKTGGNHFKRGISLPMFKNLGKTIVGLLVDKLGNTIMNATAIEAWTKTYGVIVNVVEKGLEEAAKGTV